MSNMTLEADTVQVMTAKEAAEFLRLGTRKLWELTATRKIRAAKIGRAVRYDRRDLVAYLEQAKKWR